MRRVALPPIVDVPGVVGKSGELGMIGLYLGPISKVPPGTL